jgi:hypothetical protein
MHDIELFCLRHTPGLTDCTALGFCVTGFKIHDLVTSSWQETSDCAPNCLMFLSLKQVTRSCCLALLNPTASGRTTLHGSLTRKLKDTLCNPEYLPIKRLHSCNSPCLQIRGAWWPPLPGTPCRLGPSLPLHPTPLADALGACSRFDSLPLLSDPLHLVPRHEPMLSCRRRFPWQPQAAAFNSRQLPVRTAGASLGAYARPQQQPQIIAPRTRRMSMSWLWVQRAISAGLSLRSSLTEAST